MRSFGALLFVLGCLATGATFASELLVPLRCLTVVAMAFGLLLFTTANRFRAVPAHQADDRVSHLFAEVAADDEFRRIAGLTDEELATLTADLSTAAYRYSTLQGGFAGRDGTQLVLALSPLHLRRACAAHELFHLARDVVHRSRGGQGGKSLGDETGVLREEAIVWQQTLAYRPVGAALEVSVLAAILVFPLMGALYAVLRSHCWE